MERQPPELERDAAERKENGEQAMSKEVKFNELLGKTLTSIRKEGADELYFYTREGHAYRMYHEQDCCESVDIDDICGDLGDLIGNPIIQADESTSEDNIKDFDESATWTFYRLATAKGFCTIRWYGSSSGYYSESVSFELI